MPTIPTATSSSQSRSIDIRVKASGEIGTDRFDMSMSDSVAPDSTLNGLQQLLADLLRDPRYQQVSVEIDKA